MKQLKSGKEKDMEDLLNRIALGEDSSLELKRVFVKGKRVTEPDSRDMADEFAAAANAQGQRPARRARHHGAARRSDFRGLPFRFAKHAGCRREVPGSHRHPAIRDERGVRGHRECGRTPRLFHLRVEDSVAHVRRQIRTLLSWRAAKLNVIGRNRRATVRQKRTYLHMPFKVSCQETFC